MEEVTLRCETEWMREDGNGEKCLVCGDVCFLSARNLYLKIEESKIETPFASLCNSCEDVIDD